MREQQPERGQGRGHEQREQFAPTRREPFRELGGPTRLGQILDEFFGPTLFGSNLFGSGRSAWPAVDVDEDDESYYVCVEAPGVKGEDLDVQIDQDTVTVRGERRRSERGQSRWSERSYGSFVRCFRLPPDAEAEQAKAEFKDGVLTLTFPKREQSRPRRVEIQTRSGDGAERELDEGKGKGSRTSREERPSAQS